MKLISSALDKTIALFLNECRIRVNNRMKKCHVMSGSLSHGIAYSPKAF